MTMTEPITDEPPTDETAIDGATAERALLDDVVPEAPAPLTDDASTPEPQGASAALTTEQIAPLIEALLFVADGPVEESALARALAITRRQLEAPLLALAAALRERGVRLQRGPDGAQLVTAPAAARYIEQFLGLEAARRLTPAALETLAIIAYRQPVTRGTLEAIRGVSCDGPIDTLRARGLIDVAGRADTPGRPTLFATTQKFLEHFGLERAEDLPALPPEVAELAPALPERAEQLVLDSLVAPDAADVVQHAATTAAGPVSPLEPAAAPVHDRAELVDADPDATRGTAPGPALPAWLGAPSALPGIAPASFVPPSAARAVLPQGNVGSPFGG